ncbi:MAG TPA: hypothetical protein DEG69_10950 [Flavobacteriaceae bacterium]|nr:hypothetical protein [Flavobacteriaceae bacterium]
MLKDNFMNKKYSDKIDSITLKTIELEELRRASQVELNILIEKIASLEKRRVELLTKINRIPLEIEWLKADAVDIRKEIYEEEHNERN